MSKTVLVTGGNGFLGSHIVLQLLQAGYTVRTSVRSAAGRADLIKTLSEHGIDNLDHLTFFIADILADEQWAKAFNGVDYFLSVASPVFFQKEPANEMTEISKAGTLRLLRFAKAAQVEKIVMTSNYGAIGFSSFDKTKLITEADWTDANQRGLSPYEKSKLLAEHAAWDYAKEHQLNFTTINPVAMFGPSLNHHFSGSFNIIKNLQNGTMKRIPDIALNVVDVRDVAKLHLLAMENSAATNQRFIASATGEITFMEIAQIIKQQSSTKMKLKKLPTFVLKIAAPFNNSAQEALLLIKLNRQVSNEKAKRLLGWHETRNNTEIILASLASLSQV